MAETCDSAFGGNWGFIALREFTCLLIGEPGDNTPPLGIGAGNGQVAEHLEGHTTDVYEPWAEHPHKDEEGLVMVFNRL
ncbi:MAG: hypothetical protein AB3N23_06720 [Paracoccaceae bacterium]